MQTQVIYRRVTVLEDTMYNWKCTERLGEPMHSAAKEYMCVTDIIVIVFVIVPVEAVAHVIIAVIIIVISLSITIRLTLLLSLMTLLF